MRKIEVIDYDINWTNQFKAEKKLLNSALAPMVCNIHHIGSTAIPGMPAKPTIDMILEVSSLSELDLNVQKLLDLGYTAKGEFGIMGRRYFEKGLPDHTHHLHAFINNSFETLRHTQFRDYVINHPDVAKEYGEIKRGLASRCNNDMELYANGKKSFIEHHQNLAISDFKGHRKNRWPFPTSFLIHWFRLS